MATIAGILVILGLFAVLVISLGFIGSVITGRIFVNLWNWASGKTAQKPPTSKGPE